MANETRIFGIGLPKTGTLSLHHALLALGIDSVHYPINDVIPGLQRFEYKALERHRAYVNCGEWHFAALDKQFTGSRFIYTWRDYDDWIVSVKNHFERYETPAMYSLPYLNRLEVFASVVFNEEVMKTIYHAHQCSVERYFRDKDNILKLNVTDKRAYAQLCDYLGLPIVNAPFPHENKARA